MSLGMKILKKPLRAIFKVILWVPLFIMALALLLFVSILDKSTQLFDWAFS